MKREFRFERVVASTNPIDASGLGSAEQILARLIATAYADDHPELFGKKASGDAIMSSDPQLGAAYGRAAEDNGGIHA